MQHILSSLEERNVLNLILKHAFGASVLPLHTELLKFVSEADAIRLSD